MNFAFQKRDLRSQKRKNHNLHQLFRNMLILNILFLFFEMPAINFFSPKFSASQIHLLPNVALYKSGVFAKPFIFQPSGKSFLMTVPYFQRRVSNINFLQNYIEENRNCKFSLVISTYERPACLNRSFYMALKYRPENCEIVLCDDGSISQQKTKLLQKIANEKHKDVYIITHNKPYGAFHTKLDGFLYSVGDFIMSLDDDDTFDPLFYQELSQYCDSNHDYVIPNKTKFMFWIKKFTGYKQMIIGYHNHVTFAFRREMLGVIPYPNHSYHLLRDDTVLMIPLFLNSYRSLAKPFERMKIYKNKYSYLLDDFCKGTHEQFRMKKNYDLIFNGYRFLEAYAIYSQNQRYLPLIKISYKNDKLFKKYFLSRLEKRNFTDYIIE